MIKLSPGHEWYLRELAKLYDSLPIRDSGIMLACPVWGPAYVAHLARWCIPSILSADSRKTLVEGGGHLALCSDMASFLALHPAIRDVERAGIRVTNILIPDQVLQHAATYQRGMFEICGMAQNLLLQRAARCGAGLHLLHPDHAYGAGFFARLATIAAEHDAILQTTVSAIVSSTLTVALERYRQKDGFLEVPPLHLNELAWTYLHQETHASLLNGTGGEGYADTATITWRADRAAYISSPAMNISWLSPKLCQAAPLVPPSTLDAELARLVPGPFYVPKAEDGMTFIELSDARKPAPASPVTQDDFVLKWWQQAGFQDAGLRFAGQRSVLAMPSAAKGCPDEETIEARHVEFMETLEAGKIAAMTRNLTGMARYPTGSAGLGMGFGHG